MRFCQRFLVGMAIGVLCGTGVFAQEDSGGDATASYVEHATLMEHMGATYGGCHDCANVWNRHGLIPPTRCAPPAPCPCGHCSTLVGEMICDLKFRCGNLWN